MRSVQYCTHFKAGLVPASLGAPRVSSRASNFRRATAQLVTASPSPVVCAVGLPLRVSVECRGCLDESCVISADGSTSIGPGVLRRLRLRGGAVLKNALTRAATVSDRRHVN